MKLTELCQKLLDLKEEVKLLKSQYDDARQSWNDREKSLIYYAKKYKTLYYSTRGGSTEDETDRPQLNVNDVKYRKDVAKEVHEIMKGSPDDQINLKIAQYKQQAKKKSGIQKLTDDINNNIDDEQYWEDEEE